MQDPSPGRCSLCDGTGFTSRRVRCPVCSGLSGTSATESADAFHQHLGRIFGDGAVAGTRGPGAADEDWSQLSELALYQKLLGVDRRYSLEMASMMPGRATRDTADRLAAIAADYRRIATLARGGLFDPPDIQRKVADALRAQGNAYESMDDLATAEGVYQEAAALYHRLGVTSEAGEVERLIRELRFRRDRDVDDAAAGLRTRLEAAQNDVVERAAAQVDLAEVHLARHDDLEAQRLFDTAEKDLMGKYRDHVTGAGTARSLTESLQAIMSEKPAEKDTPPIETVMHVRGLLQRIYAGMTQLLRDVDPDRARMYLEARTQMEGSISDGSEENRDFSQEMLKSVQSLIDLFDRDIGDHGGS